MSTASAERDLAVRRLRGKLRRAVRAWLLAASRVDPWGSDGGGGVVAARVGALGVADRTDVQVLLAGGDVVLRMPSERLDVLLEPGEARSLGRSLVAAASELDLGGGS